MRTQAQTLRSQLGDSRRGVSNEIFSLLLHEITSGELAPGSRLPPERELAAHFGVSQPTVREAVRALDAMGLVAVRHGSGAYVTGETSVLLNMALSTLLHLESVSILDLLEVRSVLGAYSASRATNYADDSDVAETRARAEFLADLSNVKTVDEIAQGVRDFAVAVAQASHNRLLVGLESFIIGLMVDLQVSARPHTVPAWRKFTGQFADDRAAIVDALSARDEKRLVSAMATYLDRQHEVFIRDSKLSSARLSPAGSLRTLTH